MKDSVGVALWVVVAAVGCAPASVTPRPIPPSSPAEDPDALFASGYYRPAQLRYAARARDAASEDQRARATFMAAMCGLAQGSEAANEGYAALEALPQRFPSTIWAHLAKAYTSEVVHGQALTKAIFAAGAQLQSLESEIEELEARQLDRDIDHQETRDQLGALKEERKKLKDEVETLTQQSASQIARIKELEAELTGLKRIDMQREP